MAPLSEHRRRLARGDYAEAERLLLAALASQPGQGPLHLDAVRLYHLLGEPERAAQHLGQARELGRRGGVREPSLRLAEAADHLASGDARASAEALAPLLREGDTQLDPHERHEAWVLAAEGELELGNTFRAQRWAEKASSGPGARDQPDLVARAMLVSARCHAAKAALDRAEESAGRARDLAVREDLKDVLAQATACLGELLLARAPAGERTGGLRSQAESCFRAARDLWERLAGELEAERQKGFLAHPRRRIAQPSSAPPAAEAQVPLGRRLVATLSEMSALINSMTDLDALLERVMDIAIGISGAERGLVVLVEGPGDGLEVRVARNLAGSLGESAQEFSRQVVRDVVAEGREVIAFDTTLDERMRAQNSVLLYSIRSLACFPLKVRDQALGAVYLDNQKASRVYTPEDLDFLRAFTNLAAIAIENSRLLSRLKEENVYLKRVASDRFRRTNIIGEGPAMERVLHLVEKAMDSNIPLLVTGETGTGKEVVTKAVHFGSARKDKPFIAQNCAAIPSELLESEMFGYKRGAFTGADQDKKGLFEIAHGGTLFLDEIGELDLALQAKLLRVLQDGTIRRVGETGERRVDVRVIAATNRNLKDAVDRGTFRLDLYYRLNVLQIDLPPLRQRREDIPLLAQHFLDKVNRQMGKAFRGFTPEAMERLVAYSWPGNVRELENAVARAAVFADGSVIGLDSLPTFLTEGTDVGLAGPRQPIGGPAGPAPAAAAAGVEAQARALLGRVEAGEGNFWDLVKRPFLKRDVPREVVREVVRLALEKSGWKYTRAIESLRLPADEYRRFMNFLAKFDLKSSRPFE